MTTFEIRRENLRRYILDKFGGNRAAFGRAAGVHQNQINLILTENDAHQRNLGEALARKMEAALGLPPGELDKAPSDSAEAATTVATMSVEDRLHNVLRLSTMFLSVALRPSWLSGFDSRITAPENVHLVEIATDDMAPDLHVGDCVLIDVGATTVTVDGIYVLARGDDAFLRRVQKQISGGFLITADPSRHPALAVENMKKFKVMGRVLLAVGVRRV